MTVPQPSESARLAQLEQRVQALEDVNAIRHLKARYAAYCDDQYNPDGLAALFTEDAVWESQGLGRFEGREAIRAFFRGASQLFTFAIHYSLNGQIDVQGDTARPPAYRGCRVGTRHEPPAGFLQRSDRGREDVETCDVLLPERQLDLREEILSQSSCSRRPKIGSWGPQRIRHQYQCWYRAKFAFPMQLR